MYPAVPRGRRVDAVILTAAAVVLFATFAMVVVVAFILGIVSRTIPAVIFGVFGAAVLSVVAREALFRRSTRLEFTDGLLTWYNVLPRHRPRSGHVRSIRYPAKARYVSFETVDGGEARVEPHRELKQFIDSIQAASPTVTVDLASRRFLRRWVSGKPPSAVETRIRRLAEYRGVRFLFAIAVGCVILGVAAELGLTVIGAQQNAKTLRSDLAHIQLERAGYRMTAQHQIGTCAFGHDCEINQTWAWSGPNPPTAPAMCRDADQAMKSAFGQVDPNTPFPKGAACDYNTTRSSILHPGQGKRSIDLIVRPDASGDPVIGAIASY